MGMRVCLDTSAYSNFRRAQADVVRIVSSAEWIGIPAIAIGELELGFRRGAQRTMNSDALQEFINHDRVEVLSVNRQIAEIYADIFEDRLHVGNPLPINDIWIAATSAGYGSTLVTFDDHFRSISRIASIVL